MDWLKRFRKSGPYIIVVGNIILAIIVCATYLLLAKFSSHFADNTNRIIPTFFIVLIPSYIAFPLFISRLCFDYKHKDDNLKDGADWNEGLYEIFKIGTVALFILIIIIAFIVRSCSDHRRGYDYYRDTEYWETL